MSMPTCLYGRCKAYPRMPCTYQVSREEEEEGHTVGRPRVDENRL